MSVYRAEEQPRWQPRTQQDIEKVIADGLLHETHYVEIKREVGSLPRENKEIAKDLAGLSLDGGLLLIGVGEDKDNRTWSLAPQRLEGLGERIERIGMQSVDPPLFVRCQDIRSSEDEIHGYVAVHVLASATAPHMVDGVYYGRADRMRIRLSDAEVLRHHAHRESSEAVAARLLDEEIRREPLESHFQSLGHLYGVAQPLTARRDIAQAFVRGPMQPLLNFVGDGEAQNVEQWRAFAPTPDYAQHRQHRSHGTAMSSYAALGPGRTMLKDSSSDESGLLDLELREDGGLRLLVGRLTDEIGPGVNGVKRPQAILDGLAVAYSIRLVQWARAMGEVTGYHGTWIFGLHGTRMRGLRSSVHAREMGYASGPAFDDDHYRETTTATHFELLEQPRAVASRLAGRLVRALATETEFQSAFVDG